MSELSPTPPPNGMNPNFDLERDVIEPAALTPEELDDKNLVPKAVAAANRLQDELFVDAKTGLENSRFFNQELTKTIENLEPGDELIVSMYDIDDFKKWNDTLGHLEADDLLGLVGAAFGKVFKRETDIWESARLQGDEFVTSILRSKGANERRHNTAFDEAEIQARRVNGILPEVLKGTKFEGLDIQLTHGSISYRPGDTARDMLIKADIQMLQNKVDKKGNLAAEDIQWLQENESTIRKLFRIPDWMKPYIQESRRAGPQPPPDHPPNP